MSFIRVITFNTYSDRWHFLHTPCTPADTSSVVTKRNGEREEKRNKKQTLSKENVI